MHTVKVKRKTSHAYRFNDYLQPLIQNRVHIAICSAAAVWTVSLLTGSQILNIDLFIVPVMMVCIYQWNRLFDLNEDLINSPKRAYLTFINKKRIKYFCYSSAASGLILSFITGPFHSVLILGSVILLGVFYSTPFFSISKKRLKNLMFVKNLTSAMGWTLLTVIYPLLHSGSSLSPEHWYAAITMFTSVWIVELLWDIRDKKGDAKSGVKTIPVMMGVRATRYWILMINSSAILIILGGFSLGTLDVIWLFLLLNNILIYIWTTRQTKTLYSRNLSHLLVGMQTLLLVTLGFYAFYFN